MDELIIVDWLLAIESPTARIEKLDSTKPTTNAQV